MRPDRKSDVIVVGGGVIGLSIAYELSGRGAEVTLLEKGDLGRKASWAGAGILPPANSETAIHPLEQLEALSRDLHARWASQLRDETGIDNQYWECGGIHLARTPGDVATLLGAAEGYRAHDIPFRELDQAEIESKIPSFRGAEQERQPKKAIWLGREAQICNPEHLRALAEACVRRKVEFRTRLPDVKLELDRSGSLDEEVHVKIGDEALTAASICVAAGAWSGQLLAQLDVSLPMIPIRGQIVLFKLPQPVFEFVIYEGSRYLVPRRDGHVLAGATVEEAGFDESTTEQAVSSLKEFTVSLIPELDASVVKKSWAGLRPGTFDGFPFLGRVSRFKNLFVSTGHFKAGLHLSTATGVVMADLIQGGKPAIDLSPFSPDRVTSSQ